MRCDGNLNVVLYTSKLQHMSISEKRMKADKLHRQLNHASKEKLKTLVKNSKDFNDPDFLRLIDECVDKCKLCFSHKRVPPRPVVTLPLADRFNQVVCMDLKEYIHNKSWILHLIDAATRYSCACIVYSKNPDEIVSKIFLMWVAYFGCPMKFLSDNGGEFSNAMVL